MMALVMEALIVILLELVVIAELKEAKAVMVFMRERDANE